MTSEELQTSGGREEMSMAALLDEETAAYPELRRGEIIEGVVVGNDRDGILVDIGAKSEGVVPPNEMHCLQPEGASRLQQGDNVLVFVLQPESPEGQIILSLDRARGERGWRVLQDYMDQSQAFEGYVTGSNKGGLLVNVEGVNAFVPLSQIVSGPERGSPENTQRALAEWVGRNITLKVIELNRRRNRAILSERAALQEKRAAEKERLLQELQEGDLRTGRITSIRDFGIFVDIGGADGLVHLSELSWERTPKSPHELFHVGEEVPVYVLKVDNETKKIALSVRRAQPERWEEIVSRYREGQIVPGQVTKLAPFGAFVRLEGPIEGLIHISELVDRRINHPKEVVNEGDVVPVKIVRIEYDRHRLGLSLRQARNKAEDDGWGFDESGRVVSPLPEALEIFGASAPVIAEAPADSEEAAGEVAVPEDTIATEEAAVDVVTAGPEATEEAQAEEPAAIGPVEAAVAEEEAGEPQAEEPAEAESIAEEAAEAGAQAEPEAAVAEEVAEETAEEPVEVASDAEAQAEAEAAVAEEVAEETAEEPVEVAADAGAQAEAEAAVAQEVAEETVEEPAEVAADAEAQAEPEAAVAEEVAEETVEEPAEVAAEAGAQAEPEAAVAEEVAEETVEEPAEVAADAGAQAEAEAAVAEEVAEVTAEEPAMEVDREEEPAQEQLPESPKEEAAVTESPPDALNKVEEA